MEDGPNKRQLGTAAVLVVAVLVVLNVWLLGKVFSSPSSDLPRLKLSAGDAASFLRDRQEITWRERRNILVLGKSGGDYIAPELTDTIIILGVDPVADPPEAKIVSIPRDLLIQQEGFLMRVNALWLYAQQKSDDPTGLIKSKIGEIVGLPIDAVLMFDLDTAKKIVETVGGITVYVPEDIYDPHFPTSSGGYETFELQRGWRYLSSQDALRFARTRASEAGDFDRIHHQQELLRALKGKVASLNPVWNFGKLWSIFNVLKEGIITDLSANDIKNLWAVGERVGFDKVETMSIDVKSGLVKAKKIDFGGQQADVLVLPGDDQFDYSRIKEAVKLFLEE